MTSLVQQAPIYVNAKALSGKESAGKWREDFLGTDCMEWETKELREFKVMGLMCKA